jgi:hypothetical protein
VLRRAALTLCCLALLGAAGCSGSSPQRAEPAGWRIVYRVDDTAGPTPRVTTQVVEVFPPYGGRSVTSEGERLGGTSLGGAAWTRGHQYLVDADGAAHEVATVAAGFAGPDSHLDVALASALAHGLVRRGGTSSVAGAACTEWLSRMPLDAGDVALPASGETTTTCVDAQGRLLRDRWTLDGKVVRTRTAVSIGRPDGSPLDGATPTPAPAAQLPVLVKTVEVPALATALGIAVPAGPAGLKADGGSALLERNLADGTMQPLREGASFVWRDGTRMVTLEVQRGLGHREPAPTSGVPVTLVSGLAARLKPVVSGLQVKLLTPSGLAVTAVGDLPERDLLTWLGSLRWDAVAGP